MGVQHAAPSRPDTMKATALDRSLRLRITMNITSGNRMIATVAVLLPLYHYGVRPTFIGAVLNGRRYPIGPGVAITVAG